MSSYSNSEHLKRALRAQPIGDTDDGTAWAIKALHPADDHGVVQGMPTFDSTSVVNISYLKEVLISPPDEMTGDTWDADIWLLRDPVTFGCYQTAGSDGSDLTYGRIGNEQLGVNLVDQHQALADLAEGYRVSYMGLTGHLNAPAMADQGTVRACQYVFPSTTMPSYTAGYAADQYPEGNGLYIGRNVRMWTDNLLDYNSLIQMPKCYSNVAREGFYMPLKMSPGDEHWINTNDREFAFGLQPAYTSGREPALLSNKYSTNALGGVWPYYCTEQEMANSRIYVYKPGNQIGHISFRGLSKGATLQLIYRVGVDMKVRPMTRFSPFIHDPPVYDATALKMYFEIARRMADAYPASYNSVGTLFNIVSGIAKEIWPLVLPHAQTLLSKLMEKINAKVQSATARKQDPPAKQADNPKTLDVKRNPKRRANQPK